MSDDSRLFPAACPRVSASVFGEPPPRPPASTPRWQGLEQDVRLKGRAGKRVCAGVCFKGRMVGAEQAVVRVGHATLPRASHGWAIGLGRPEGPRQAAFPRTTGAAGPQSQPGTVNVRTGVSEPAAAYRLPRCQRTFASS